MTYLFFSAAVFVSLHLIVLLIAIKNRDKIMNMVGMMISMTLGMTSGLGVGTIMGILYNNQIFEATIISILIGSFVGAISGLITGLLAVLDGFLAGIMAGMMGAMLAIMISPDHYLALFRIIALVLGTALMILTMLIEQELYSRQLALRIFFLSCLLVFGFFVFQTELPLPVHHEGHI